MKKFFTLLIVLTGFVSVACAKTIYLENNWNKANIWVGVGDTQEDGSNSWSKLVKIGNRNDHEVFVIELGDATYFRLTFTNSGDGNTGINDYLTTGSVTDGKCYQFNWTDKTELAVTSDVTVYTYNFSVTTADEFENVKIYPYRDAKPIGWAWGDSPNMTKSGNVYTYTLKAIYSDVSVIFRPDEAQTCDLSAVSGTNNYYIDGVVNSKISDSWGFAVKTNAYGLATYNVWGAMTISEGIAFCAEDNGNGSATAHSVTNPVGNTPMIIKGEASTTYHFAIAESGTPLGYTNALKVGSGSTLASVTDGKYNYILNGNTFKAANGMTVALLHEFGAQLQAFDNNGTPLLEYVEKSGRLDAANRIRELFQGVSEYNLQSTSP